MLDNVKNTTKIAMRVYICFFWKDSMINRLSNLINRNRSAAKISQVLCSNRGTTALPCGLHWSIFKRSSTTSATNLKRCRLKSFDNQCSLHRVGLMDEPLGCPCRANTSRSLCFTFFILLYIGVLHSTFAFYFLHLT